MHLIFCCSTSFITLYSSGFIENLSFQGSKDKIIIFLAQKYNMIEIPTNDGIIRPK